MALYLTADGKSVIAGNLYDAQGNDLSSATLKKLVYAPMAKLDGNMKLMDELELSVTLAIFYLDDKGGLQQQQGAPSPDKLVRILGAK